MTDLVHLCKSQSLKLAPFFNFVILYFVFVQNPQGELWTTLLKCAPIVSLMFFVVTKGFNCGKEFRYSQLVLMGLIFSCGGDILLNIDLFPHGMASFAVAQVFYISAFGFKPLKPRLAVPLYVMGAILVSVMFSGLEGVLIVGLPLYVTLLLTMCWRALARATDQKTPLIVFCGIGSALFVVSDGLIGIDMFLIRVPNAKLWIMITYYLAQFAIALSTNVECPKIKSGKLSPNTTKAARNSSSARRLVKSKD